MLGNCKGTNKVVTWYSLYVWLLSYVLVGVLSSEGINFSRHALTKCSHEMRSRNWNTLSRNNIMNCSRELLSQNDLTNWSHELFSRNDLTNCFHELLPRIDLTKWSHAMLSRTAPTKWSHELLSRNPSLKISSPPNISSSSSSSLIVFQHRPYLPRASSTLSSTSSSSSFISYSFIVILICIIHHYPLFSSPHPPLHLPHLFTLIYLFLIIPIIISLINPTSLSPCMSYDIHRSLSFYIMFFRAGDPYALIIPHPHAVSTSSRFRTHPHPHFTIIHFICPNL